MIIKSTNIYDEINNVEQKHSNKNSENNLYSELYDSITPIRVSQTGKQIKCHI